jgi:hypothetical protein
MAVSSTPGEKFCGVNISSFHPACVSAITLSANRSRKTMRFEAQISWKRKFLETFRFPGTVSSLGESFLGHRISWEFFDDESSSPSSVSGRLSVKAEKSMSRLN